MKIYKTFSGNTVIHHDTMVAITELNNDGTSELKLIPKTDFDQWMKTEYLLPTKTRGSQS